MKFYHKISFWQKLEKQLAIISGFSVVGMGYGHAPYWSFIAIGVAGILAKSVFIWIEDHNNNGIVDWYEK